jgi:hypothetical protein
MAGKPFTAERRQILPFRDLKKENMPIRWVDQAKKDALRRENRFGRIENAAMRSAADTPHVNHHPD